MFEPERLTAARVAAGLSKAALARKTELSIAAIQGYERGRRAPNAEQLEKLAKALCCSSDYLLGLVSATEDKLILRIIKAVREAYGESDPG